MSLSSHNAVASLGHGVSSVDLADLIGQIAQRTQQRVLTIGDSQYGGAVQKFETMSPEKIFDELLDEVADVYAYAAFLAIHAMAVRNVANGVRGDDA